MKYKAVLFDFFHTLTSIYHTGNPGQSTAELLGIDEEAWRRAVFFDTHRRLRGDISDPEEILLDIAANTGVKVQDKLLKAAAANRVLRFSHCMKHIPDSSIQCLAALKEQGYKLVLVSNADKTERIGFEESRAGEYFDAVLFSCDVGFFKPQKEIYEMALQAVNLDACEAVFVGDGGSDEHKGASALGLTCVLTSEFIRDTNPELVTQRLPLVDYHIEALLDLIPLMGKLNSP